MDNEEQKNQEEQQDNQKSGGGNIGYKAADAAKGVAKNAENVSNKLGSGAEKFRNKANAQKEIAQNKAGTKAGTNAAAKAQKLEQKAEKLQKTAQKAQKVAQKAEKFAQVATKIGKFITWAGLIILIIMIVVGLVVFLVTGWGMLLSGFKEISKSFYDVCFSIIKGGENNVKDNDIINLMNNIEQMGYDLYGYGFVSSTKTETDENGKKVDVYYEGDKLDKDLEKKDAYRYLTTYLISDNYAYFIKNHNLNFKSMLTNLNNFFGGIFDKTEWGSGLISIYTQEGDKEITGIPDEPYGNLSNQFKQALITGKLIGPIERNYKTRN